MTMYFNLIKPVEGAERVAVHERLDGPYADHQWLWSWLPAEPGTPRDFLFRRFETNGLPRFYAVSQRRMPERRGAWQCQGREYDPNVAAGNRLQFELRANPTVRHGRDGKSKRHDVVMEAKKKLLSELGLKRWKDWEGDDKPPLQLLVQQACGHWLSARGQANGFAPDTNSLIVESYVQHREKFAADLMFTSVDFRGELTVTEPAAFKAALLKGIGHAKAFGCGLLLVRPVGQALRL